MDETIIALENVSGSPITNEGHDLMASLYKADGGLMVGGVGFLHHLTSAAQAVKHILATYSEDPGIYEDDVYFLNDSYTAALHPPDVYLISPIHHEGRLTRVRRQFRARHGHRRHRSRRLLAKRTRQLSGGLSVEGAEDRRARPRAPRRARHVPEHGARPGNDAARPEVAARREPRGEAADEGPVRGLRGGGGRHRLRRVDQAVGAPGPATAGRTARRRVAGARVHRHAWGKRKSRADGDQGRRHPHLRLHGLEPAGRARRQLLLLGDVGRPVRADLPAARVGRDVERGCDAPDQARRAGGHGRQLHPPRPDLDRDGRDDPDRQQPLHARALEALRREREVRRPCDRGLARKPRPRRDTRPRRRMGNSSSRR